MRIRWIPRFWRQAGEHQKEKSGRNDFSGRWVSGLVVIAGGVIALMVGLGVITRFIGISHTAKHVRIFEDAILLGSVFGTLMTVYQPTIPLDAAGLAVLGLFSGFCGRLDSGAGGDRQHFPDFDPPHRSHQRLKPCGHRDRPGKNERKPDTFLSSDGRRS